MRILGIALIAIAQIALVILVSRAVMTFTGDALSAVLVVLILTIAVASWFTTGSQPRRQRSCG